MVANRRLGLSKRSFELAGTDLVLSRDEAEQAQPDRVSKRRKRLGHRYGISLSEPTRQPGRTAGGHIKLVHKFPPYRLTYVDM